MAEQITSASKEIADILGTLPDVKTAYWYPKQVLEFNDLCLEVLDVQEPDTFLSAQYVIWNCVVRLRSVVSGAKPEDLEEMINRLTSNDRVQGISGVLESEANADRLQVYGSPRVISDFDVLREHQEEDGPVVTYVVCGIGAYVANT